MQTTTTMTELEQSQCRLWNAEAAKLEFELAKAKRELLTVPECYGLLDQMRVCAIEKVSWQEQSVLQKHLDNEMMKIQATIKTLQEQARW